MNTFEFINWDMSSDQEGFLQGSETSLVLFQPQNVLPLVTVQCLVALITLWKQLQTDFVLKIRL